MLLLFAVWRSSENRNCMHLAQDVYRLLRAWGGGGADFEIRAECTDVSLRMLSGGGGGKKEIFWPNATRYQYSATWLGSFEVLIVQCRGHVQKWISLLSVWSISGTVDGVGTHNKDAQTRMMDETSSKQWGVEWIAAQKRSSLWLSLNKATRSGVFRKGRGG